MDWIFLIIVVAVTVEALVEYGKSIWQLFAEKNKKSIALQLCALAGGIVLCLVTGADIYSPIGIVFKYLGVGCLLTGVFASRGANYVSDLIGRLRNGGGYTEVDVVQLYDEKADIAPE